ncbi:hypothetical protein [Consotaella aegiceratis]|uniref:hypothetical protein n=1 Tax=Consotaella aegiceratis TaxID=3097961 RepID=UPI002F40F231
MNDAIRRASHNVEHQLDARMAVHRTKVEMIEAIKTDSKLDGSINRVGFRNKGATAPQSASAEVLGLLGPQV